MGTEGVKKMVEELHSPLVGACVSAANRLVP